MDIQGIEYDIISNFKQDTIDLINFILVGTHSEKIHTDCRDFLEKHNFDIIFDNWKFG